MSKLRRHIYKGIVLDITDIKDENGNDYFVIDNEELDIWYRCIDLDKGIKQIEKEIDKMSIGIKEKEQLTRLKQLLELMGAPKEAIVNEFKRALEENKDQLSDDDAKEIRAIFGIPEPVVEKYQEEDVDYSEEIDMRKNNILHYIDCIKWELENTPEVYVENLLEALVEFEGILDEDFE
jgi:hypothetical protein